MNMAGKQPFKIPGQFEYQDMLLGENYPVDILNKVVNIQLGPSDMVVASYPKTGTTLLQEIVWLVRNNVDLEGAQKTLNFDRVPYIDLAGFDTVAVFQALPHPRTMKTHVPYRLLPKGVLERKNKMICSFRNPNDTLVSYYHFHRMHAALGNFPGTWNDFFEYFVESGDKLLYGSPIDHMLGYWEHRNENMLIVFYEDMVCKRLESIKEIADFVGVSLSEEQIHKVAVATEFDAMKNCPMTNFSWVDVFDQSVSPFLRKGKIGDWKNYFSEEQSCYLDDMCQRKLAGSGLEFVYE